MLESIISISFWELTFFIINFLKNDVYRNGIHPHNHGYYQHQISSSSLFESINRLAPRIDPLSFNLSGFPSITGSFTQYHQSIHSSPSDYWLFLEGPREQKVAFTQLISELFTFFHKYPTDDIVVLCHFISDNIQVFFMKSGLTLNSSVEVSSPLTNLPILAPTNTNIPHTMYHTSGTWCMLVGI